MADDLPSAVLRITMPRLMMENLRRRAVRDEVTVAEYVRRAVVIYNRERDARYEQ